MTRVGLSVAVAVVQLAGGCSGPAGSAAAPASASVATGATAAITPSAPLPEPYSEAERVERTRAFGDLDANHDGALAQAEMATAVGAQARLMISRYDFDRDGGLSRAELDNTRTPPAELEDLFREDRNHDGVLTPQELLTGAAEAFARRDANHDGAQSLEEFLTRPPRP